MSTVKTMSLVSGALQNVVSTSVDTETSIIRGERSIIQDRVPCADKASINLGGERLSARREAWERVIDHTLIAWGSAPWQLEDEGVDPPSRETIYRAILLAQDYRDQGRPAPDSVVPDPNGGVVFERQEGDVSEVLHIWEDGTTEYQFFQGTRLLERRTL